MTDPRGPIRTATKVEVRTDAVVVTFDCGCTERKNPSRPGAWKVGDTGHACGCPH